MEKQPFQTPNEMMVLGLMEHAEIVTKALQEAQQGLGDQIGELTQLKEWSANAAMQLDQRATARAVALRQQAETILKGLEAEREQLQNVGVKLEYAAGQAIHNAVRTQVAQIGEETKLALVRPLEHLLEAGTQVRQAVKETKLLFSTVIFLVGLGLGMSVGYTSVVRTENRVGDRLDRLDQILSAPIRVVTEPATPAQKGKGK